MCRSIVAAVMIVAMPAGAAAQTITSFDAGRPKDSRVTIGVTIPFGKRTDAQEHKPRLELGFDHRSTDRSMRVTGTELHRQDFTKLRVGLSLSDDPHLMLNGRTVRKIDGRYNLSTVAWVGIGIVMTASLGALVLNEMLDDSSE